MPEATEKAATQPVRRKSTEIGKVVSRAGNKTIVVEVTRRGKHALYERFVNRRKKFYAHDEKNECRVGDHVRIVQSRRLSKQKTWRMQQIVARGTVAARLPEAEAAPAAS